MNIPFKKMKTPKIADKGVVTMDSTIKPELSKKGVSVNPISNLEAERNKFKLILQDLDAQQVCNRYIWENLPNGILAWRIEQMLYMRGSLAFFKSNEKFYILPFAMVGGINIYGLPVAVQPITYNGTVAGKTGEEFGAVTKKLQVNYYGDYDKDAQAILLYDRTPVYTASTGLIARAILNDKIIDEQINVLVMLRVNLLNSQGTLYIVAKEAQADIVRAEVASLYNGLLNGINVQVLTSEMALDNIQGAKADYQEQQMWQCFTSYNSLRCMVSGIMNGGTFEKKERAITGELAGDEAQTQLILDSGLVMRKLFIEQVKKQFPDDEEVQAMDVKLNGAVEPVKQPERTEVVEDVDS